MESRKRIRLLPVAVANKIAAGEVVERPASVVKEFMENAFDAGATRVEVSVVSGGRKLISIADDGCGMDRDDALLCLEPQATSKIRDVDDIERISTYGFRGEAIPSVAAVSRMIIRTSVGGDAAGTCVEIDGGKIRAVSDIGFPRGTTFEVRDLFFNVPARRKFLKTYGTEQAHIKTVFTLQALAHPEASLKFIADGREVYSLPGGATLEERVRDLLGAAVLDSLRPVDFFSPGISITGFIGLPTLTRSDRSEQYIFVNRRAATAAIVPFALRESYPPLDNERKPVVILFIETPPTEVDVNVHPTKREVRFRDARAVRDAITLAIHKALGLGAFGAAAADEIPPNDLCSVLPTNNPPAVECAAIPTPSAGPCGASADAAGPCGGAPMDIGGAVPPYVSSQCTAALPPRPVSYRPPPAPVPLPIQQRQFTQPLAGEQDSAQASDPDDPLVSAPISLTSSVWAWFRILGRITGGYVLLETNDGFVVLDPKAAHERVLYERMLSGALGGETPSQPLLMPGTVTLPAEDFDRISSNMAELRSIGFGIDTFGNNTFIVEALPQGMDPGDIRGTLTDISRGIAEAGGKRGVNDWKLKVAAQSAAAAAISRMAPLPYQALSRLIEDLAHTKMPYTTPRNKVTMFLTTTRELDRRFGG